MKINAIAQGDYSPYPSDKKRQNQPEKPISPQATASDPAGATDVAIFEKMTSQLQGLSQGIANAAAMNELVNTAQSGLSAISENLQRIRELSLAAINGTLTQEDRIIMQNEVSGLMSGINNAASMTEFNGIKLLNGTFVNRNTAVSPNGSGRSVSIGNMSLSGLALTGLDVTGNSDISRVDSALGKVMGSRASLGSVSNSLGYAIAGNEAAIMNLSAARSRFAGANIARASGLHSQNRVIEQYQQLMEQTDVSSAKNALNNTLK